jgi:nucleoside-diphosphate-sugar epimerase
MPYRAFVTGASGFVGAGLCRRLLADGHEVVAVVRPATDLWRLQDLDGSVQTVAVDLGDQAAMSRVLASTRPEWVFHLAAHGAYSWQNDTREILTVNTVATAGLLDLCRDADVRAFVHAGSSSEYGVRESAPGEYDALDPNSTYAVSKAAATHYARLLSRTQDRHIVVLRLYSVYGIYEQPRRLMPTLIANGLRGSLPPLVSPDIARDFVYLDDVCDAFVSAAEAEQLERGSVFNVGSGRQTTLGELVDLVRAEWAISDDPDWGSMEARKWDTSTWVADISRIRAELGWTPRFDLPSGIERMASWMRASPDMIARYVDSVA